VASATIESWVVVGLETWALLRAAISNRYVVPSCSAPDVQVVVPAGTSATVRP
jgi:hypothetical protein